MVPKLDVYGFDIFFMLPFDTIIVIGLMCVLYGVIKVHFRFQLIHNGNKSKLNQRRRWKRWFGCFSAGWGMVQHFKGLV